MLQFAFTHRNFLMSEPTLSWTVASKMYIMASLLQRRMSLFSLISILLIGSMILLTDGSLSKSNLLLLIPRMFFFFDCVKTMVSKRSYFLTLSRYDVPVKARVIGTTPKFANGMYASMTLLYNLMEEVYESRIRLPDTDSKKYDQGREGQAFPYFMPWLSGDGGSYPIFLTRHSVPNNLRKTVRSNHRR